VKSFLKFCKENDVPVDFVTTHQYSGDPLGGVEDQGDPMADGEGSAGFDVKAFLNSMGPKLKNAQGHSMLEGLRALMGDQSEERDIPNDGFFRNSAIVRKQAGDMPLYYTEWNENAGFGSYTNDTRKVAAYDVKAALDVMDNMDGSSIWCFSDVFEEFHPFPEEFHGGFGMLSQSGIPKPVYHAMKMLADAGDERLVLDEKATWGEIGIAAFRQEKNNQVLLFRQKMKNLDLPKEKAVVRIEQPEAPRQVLLRRVDEEHGNPLKLWENMGRPQDLNRREVEQLKRQSAVNDESWPFAYENGVLTLEAELGVNDVYFFEIR
jgi:xylan 1,4-beta-xylosidase